MGGIGDDRAAAGSPAFFQCPGACILCAAIGVQKDENQMPNGGTTGVLEL